jgi:ABC-type Na+ efflux pump permease subunit
MNKTLLIIQREFLSRVRKKSFIIMTILGPILIAGFISLAIWMTLKEPEMQLALVVDEFSPIQRIRSRQRSKNLEKALLHPSSTFPAIF